MKIVKKYILVDGGATCNIFLIFGTFFILLCAGQSRLCQHPKISQIVEVCTREYISIHYDNASVDQ